MGRLFSLVCQALLTFAVLGAGLWGAGLLLFRLNGAIAILGALGFGLAVLAGIIGIWNGAPRLILGFAMVFVGLLGWWAGLPPSHQRNWIPELDRLPQITREGETITVANLRDFRWRSEQDYEQRWETRRYDLTKIEGTDILAIRIGAWVDA